MINREYVQTSAGRIHCYEQGSGSPLLMLHETPRSGWSYAPLIGRLSDRYRCIAPDTLGFGMSDPLPEGADAMSLVRVLHDHDDGAAQSLLNRIARFLPSGGRLIVAEPMAGIAGSEAMGEAYFGFYLMAMGSGRPRGADEIEAMLQKAGFRQVRRLRTPRPMLASVIEAIR